MSEYRPYKPQSILNRKQVTETITLSWPFTIGELNLVIAKCNRQEAAGFDDILIQQIKHWIKKKQVIAAGYI